MKKQWLAMEHYRLHTIEEWPNSPAKQAALAAVRSSIESLCRGMAPSEIFECDICLSRKRVRPVIAFPLPLAA